MSGCLPTKRLRYKTSNCWLVLSKIFLSLPWMTRVFQVQITEKMASKMILQSWLSANIPCSMGNDSRPPWGNSIDKHIPFRDYMICMYHSFIVILGMVYYWFCHATCRCQVDVEVSKSWHRAPLWEKTAAETVETQSGAVSMAKLVNINTLGLTTDWIIITILAIIAIIAIITIITIIIVINNNNDDDHINENNDNNNNDNNYIYNS